MSEIVDGIYFNMPMAQYREVKRLSSTGIGRLRQSAGTYWEKSDLNPNCKDEEKDYLVYGEAYHCARLEPEHFHDRFFAELDKTDMPDGTLFTGTDMGNALAAMGLKKSGSVAEQADRLRAAGYEGHVWQWALADWIEECGDRIPLPAQKMREIEEDGKRLHSMPMIAEKLTNGAAEVSVLWTCPKTGIQMKARFDYIKPGLWCDAKTFEPKGKGALQAINDAILNNRYTIQMALYREAMEAVRSDTIRVHGSDGDFRLIEAIRNGPEPECWYIFQRKGGIPDIYERRIEFFDTPLSAVDMTPMPEQRTPQAWYTKAMREIMRARRDFAIYSEVYEPGQPWLPLQPSGTFGDADCPPWYLDQEV